MPVYFEAAAVIKVLVLLGQVLELKARESTGGAIRALLDLAPKTAWRVSQNGTDEEISLDQIVVSDLMRVRPGDKVAVDGTVGEGRSGGDLDPSSLTWGQLAFCYAQNVPLGGDCDGLVMNAVRYDTPAVAGFSASVSWGEDDDWQLAGRYAGEIGAFKILLGAGYSNSTDEGLVTPLAAIVKKDTSYFQAGGYAEHTPTGLFVHGAYGHADNSGVVLTGGVTPPDGEHWHIKAGLRAKWSLLGATVIYGTYAEYEDQIGPAAIALGVTSSEVWQSGGGIVQELDGAAMSLWLKYRETGGSIAGAPGAGTIEALHTVSAGALINF